MKIVVLMTLAEIAMIIVTRNTVVKKVIKIIDDDEDSVIDKACDDFLRWNCLINHSCALAYVKCLKVYFEKIIKLVEHRMIFARE